MIIFVFVFAQHKLKVESKVWSLNYTFISLDIMKLNQWI